jgi:polyferredoxin
MSKADAIKERLAKYREVLKAIIWSVLALFTGIVTVAYQVLIHKISAYMIIFGLVGLILIFVVLLYGGHIWGIIGKLEKELENV